MPAVQIIETTAAEWGVFVQMRGVLCKVGAIHQSEQATRSRNACGHRQVPGESWPGCRFGVRAPAIDETPLSTEEALFGLSRSLL